MTTIGNSNPLSSMLNNAFTRLDRDGSKSLDRGEFQSFYEVLKPGIAVGKDGKPLRSESDEFNRFDKNSDGVVAQAEIQTTGVLMPAELTDDSLIAMIEYLKRAEGVTANAAALFLAEGSPEVGSTGV